MGEMTSSWAALLGLGAFHGINPGMGWLFAVALGLQERRRGAVLSALCRWALGHALAVAAAIALAVAGGRGHPVCSGCAGRGGDPDRLRREPLVSAPASTLGQHARQQGRPYAVVVSDGLRARRRPDGRAALPRNGHARRRP